MEEQVPKETKEETAEETPQQPTEQNYFSRIKKIFTKEFAKKNLTAIISSTKNLKNKTKIAVAIGAIGLSCLAFTSYEYFQIKRDYTTLNQKFSQIEKENSQLNQEQETLNQEHAKTLEELTQNYSLALQEQEQLKRKNQELTNEDKQTKQQSQELDKRYKQLEEENKKTLKEISLLSEKYQTIANENEQLIKKQEELREKEAKTLEELTREHISLTEYHSEYGFPNYKEGLINKQDNWMSGDTLNNRGWQVINKKVTDTLMPSSNNILTFLPTSTFSTFSPEDNHTTFHLHSEKPIKTFIVGGEYNIKEKGYLNISISPDNKNWIVIENLDSRNQNNYRFGYFTPYNIYHFPELKIDKDLFIRHSAGALSNKDYEVEIWNFFTSMTTE